MIKHVLMAAFRYPHRTRPNSGPDQIILVLKISTEPFRSGAVYISTQKFGLEIQGPYQFHRV